MPYVKISDPNIIDVAAWHQVINVVNQHSDSINSITNNFGLQGSGVVEWNGDNDIVNEYNPGTQKILYGRKTITTSSFTAGQTRHDRQIYYGKIDFVDNNSGTKTFNGRPIINTTIQFGHSSIEALDDTLHNIVMNIYDVQKDSFYFRVTLATSTNTTNKIPTDRKFYINWTAIGPK